MVFYLYLPRIEPNPNPALRKILLPRNSYVASVVIIWMNEDNNNNNNNAR